MNIPASTLMPCMLVEVIAAVRLRQVAVCIVEIPLAAGGAGVVARRGLRIHAELRHQTGAHVVIMEIAADAKLRDVHFARAENLADPPMVSSLGWLKS